MALTKYTAPTNVIGTLGTDPEDRPDLDDQGLKDKFDQNAVNIVDFLNNTLIPEIDYSYIIGKNISQIPSGADLNSYMTPGVWYSPDSTRTASLLNTPGAAGGGKLIVEFIAGTDCLQQTWIANNSRSEIYKRTKIANTGDYQAWHRALNQYDVGSGTNISGTSGTMTVTMDGSIKTITPAGACTFNASGGTLGQRCAFVITTSGTTSYTLTWNTNFKTTGTLATGTTTAKKFVVEFVYDGTAWCEVSRTTAL